MAWLLLFPEKVGESETSPGQKLQSGHTGSPLKGACIQQHLFHLFAVYSTPTRTQQVLDIAENKPEKGLKPAAFMEEGR